MFGKKKKETVKEMKPNEGMKTKKYKCPFKTGDKITIASADLTDFPIGQVGRKDSYGWYYILWDCDNIQRYRYFLPSEIPETSDSKTKWDGLTFVSDYINKKTKEEGYLIAKVAPINGYIVADNEADMYYAALFDFTIKEWNTPSVLVRDNRLDTSTFEICAIKEILSRKEYQKRVKAEIVCAVDAEPYHYRVRVREENSKLRKTLIYEYGVDPQQLKNFEMQENCKLLLKQYQETSKYIF